MKNLMCVLTVSLVMLFGCSKDFLNDENSDLKRAKVPVPMKGEICMTYNYDVPLMHVDGTPVIIGGKVVIPDLYLSGSSWLSGHCTQMGEFRETSTMKGISAYLDMEALAQKKVVLVGVFEARPVADNGDVCIILSQVRIDATDPANRIITGEATIMGGTGKFENAGGSGTLCGLLPCWDFEGVFEFPREK